MGYWKEPETDILVLPSNSEFWVKIKRRAEFGDAEAAKGSMIKFSRAEARAETTNGHAVSRDELLTEVLSETEVTAYNTVLIARLVVEWNLTDEHDKVQPITPLNVGRLDIEDGDFLAAEAAKRRGGRSAEEQRNFPKRSGRQSTATK